eukprot:TRINITY_DN11429_c0_g1_i3.p1 TRINITY_DN11429_c0_g1~~TRINITY_DN11429_c0_g1_i3.p1  ORF type:complete len:667 (+),score=176.58 TRINITY_DN11429_c0_g1_i3:116-2002(+)
MLRSLVGSEMCIRDRAVTAQVGVKQCMVVVCPDSRGDDMLVAMVVKHEDQESDNDTVEMKPWLLATRMGVAELVPQHMVPKLVTQLQAFPLTPNGKIDRMALKDMASKSVLENQAGAQAAQVDPADPLEETLAGIWKDILRLGQISVTGNFFRLGGTSMSAMLMIKRVETELEVELRVADVFQMPTIRHMANVISGKESGTGEFKSVLCLQPPSHEDDMKIFICPAAGGLAFPQFYLAEGLAKYAAVYCFQDPSLVESRPLPGSLGALAAGWMHDMRQIQSNGPYHLLGWSFGGNVAFELAQQLRGEGEQVGSLWMLDPVFPDPARMEISSRMCFWAGIFHPQNASQWRDACMVRSQSQRSCVSVSSCFETSDQDVLKQRLNDAEANNQYNLIPSTGRMFELLGHHNMLEAQYSPSFFPGHITIMRPIQDQPWDVSLADDSKWSNVCNSLEIVECGGNHMSMLQYQHFRSLAEAIWASKWGCSPKDQTQLPLATTAVIQKVPDLLEQGSLSSFWCTATRSSVPAFFEVTVSVHYPDGRKMAWTLERRYSHFELLLSQLAASNMATSKLPELPPKKMIISVSAGQQRTQALNYFLSSLCSKCANQPAVQLFLGLNRQFLDVERVTTYGE